MPSNLGVEFWGNFYRVDTDQYTFARMHDEIKSLKLQVELKAEDAAEPTAVAKIRDNLLAVKTHLRKKGFRPPSAKDKHAVCVWDLSQVRSCNSTNLKLYLLGCNLAPVSVKAKYMTAAVDSTAAVRMSKRKLDSIMEEGSAHPSAPGAGASTAAVDHMLAHMDRELTQAEVIRLMSLWRATAMARGSRSLRWRMLSFARQWVGSTVRGRPAADSQSGLSGITYLMVSMTLSQPRQPKRLQQRWLWRSCPTVGQAFRKSTSSISCSQRQSLFFTERGHGGGFCNSFSDWALSGHSLWRHH